MKIVARWLVRKWIPDYRDVDNVKVRARYGGLEAWTSIAVNAVLFVVKLVLGLMIGSVALIADAIHTLSDTGTSIIILIGFRIAKRPGDKEHPYGHGRAESIATLIIAVLLIVTGLELLRSAALRIYRPALTVERISWVVGGILVGAILIKELLARFAHELGVTIKSKTLEADCWHHRSDAFSTVLVLVAMVGAHYGYLRVDGMAGVAVALIVIWSGYIIMREAVGPLLGEKPSAELLGEIEKTALLLPGVRGVHNVMVHRYGQINLVSLHIEVPDDKPAGELHALSEEVEDAISAKLGGDAVVHIDPLNAEHERYAEVREVVMQETARDDRIGSFHDLRITEADGQVQAEFDIVVDGYDEQNRAEQIVGQLANQVGDRLAGVTVKIKAERQYL